MNKIKEKIIKQRIEERKAQLPILKMEWKKVFDDLNNIEDTTIYEVEYFRTSRLASFLTFAIEEILTRKSQSVRIEKGLKLTKKELEEILIKTKERVIDCFTNIGLSCSDFYYKRTTKRIILNLCYEHRNDIKVVFDDLLNNTDRCLFSDNEILVLEIIKKDGK